MTPVCPDGHDSSTPDYCDVCGRPIAVHPPPPAEVPPAFEEDADTSTSTSPAAHVKQCPACDGTCPRDAKFCEDCGHDFEAPEGAGKYRELIVTVDFEWFERSRAEGVGVPEARPECRYPLGEDEVRIGRANGSASACGGEIAVQDPGVSRRHAMLECQADGSYSVRDTGSTNGTFINDQPAGIEQGKPVRLQDGDEIHIGAWTTIKVRLD